jgi:hypothetical protein
VVGCLFVGLANPSQIQGAGRGFGSPYAFLGHHEWSSKGQFTIQEDDYGKGY